MFNQQPFVDFNFLNSALVAEAKTRNSVYQVRFLAPDAVFEISGGNLAAPIRTQEAPFIMGIGAPMFAQGLRTSRVESITIKLANDDDFGTAPVWLKVDPNDSSGGAPAFAVPPERELAEVH